MTSLTRRSLLRNASLAATSLAVSRVLPGQASSAAVDARIDLMPGEAIGTIAPEIYSHFIEQLGGVVYDGVWVGEKSKIRNTRGIRQSFIDTMKAVEAPVLRWPGGCFADSYDWRDGIGPASKRPNRTAFWGQQENNRFGLHEFMDTCRLIGCKPYLAADLRSLPAKDFYQLVEYCNAPSGPLPSHSSNPPAPDTLASERASNGSPEPFNVQYWGVGNESWGCGGDQTPEEYAGELRRYITWIPNYGQKLNLVAVGPNGDDTDWTRRLFRALHSNPEDPSIWGLSCHYYTSGSATAFAAGDALKFDNAAFYDMLTRASVMDKVITDTVEAMRSTMPNPLSNHKQVPIKLVVDEWGAWYGDGTQLGPDYNLSQQSTMRDALLSGITLDIFQRRADVVGMANVAQTVNCLHSLMLAKEDQFTVTPTFHVFKMYLPHRGGTAIRSEFTAQSIDNTLANGPVSVGGNSYNGSFEAKHTLAGLSGSASVQGKTLTLSVVNPHLDRPMTTEISVRGQGSIASVTGTTLHSADVHDHNTFADPNAVHPVPATTGTPNGATLVHTFPPASVTTLQLTLA